MFPDAPFIPRPGQINEAVRHEALTRMANTEPDDELVQRRRRTAT
jgi:hypothetical protein